MMSVVGPTPTRRSAFFSPKKDYSVHVVLLKYFSKFDLSYTYSHDTLLMHQPIQWQYIFGSEERTTSL